MIANLPWLHHVLAVGKLDSPCDRMLHYPLPSTEGLSEFQGLIMTISNYAGPARDYVRALIEALGAKFEGAMSRTTSYVVTARSVGLFVLDFDDRLYLTLVFQWRWQQSRARSQLGHTARLSSLAGGVSDQMGLCRPCDLPCRFVGLVHANKLHLDSRQHANANERDSGLGTA